MSISKQVLKNSLKFVHYTDFLTALLLAAGCMTACVKDDDNKDSTPTPASENLWVDLGLPSGLPWASHNVGATAPEEYGGYFARGETTTKSTYGQNTYAYHGIGHQAHAFI